MVEAEKQPCQKGPEVLVDSKLEMNQPQPLGTKIARSILVCMNNSAARTLREVIIPFCSVGDIYNPGSSFGPPSTRKLLKTWGSAEATEVAGAGGWALSRGWGSGAWSACKREAMGAPNSSFPFLIRIPQGTGARLNTVACAKEWETKGICWNKGSD